MSAARVLFVTGEYPPMSGGVGDYTAQLRLALAGSGVSSLVAAPAEARDAELAVAFGWRLLRRLPRLAREHGVSVAHIQYQAGAFDPSAPIHLLPDAMRRAGVLTVTTFHDLLLPRLFPRAGRLRRVALLRLARGSAAVVVTNPADERVLARAGLSPHRIPIGPNLPPPPPVAVERGTVGFFGFPSRGKGVLALIDALGAVPAARRPRLVLIGGQGTPSPRNDIIAADVIDGRAAARGVMLERTGWLAPAAASARLAAMEAIAMPFANGVSQRSGSLLAALQAGRPVVACGPADPADLGALAALPQLTLVPDAGPSALAGALVELSERPAAPLPHEYRWQSIAARHRELYDSLAGASW